MEHPAFQNRFFITIYILIWTIISLSISLVIIPLVLSSFELCLLFGSISGYVFGGVALLLWNVVKYADYSSQNGLQRIVSYLALALVSISVWLCVTYFLLYLLLPENDVTPFVPLIPLESMFGCAFFTIVVMAYNSILENKKASDEDEELQEIEQSVTPQISDPAIEILERIAVKVGQKIELILVPEIFIIQAEGDYVMIHTYKGHYMKEQTMKYFEEHLPSTQFVRVHRSYIVNVQSISKVELFEKQNQLLTLQNGMQIKASAAGYKQLKKALNL